jgi:hypothetical protein
MGGAMQVDERGDVRVGEEDDGAAITTVTTVRTAERDVGLAAIRDGSCATVPAADMDRALVDERGRVHGLAPGCIGDRGREKKCDGRPRGPP